MDRVLLAELIQANPFEPATQVWRAAELNELLAAGLPPGRGLDLGCGDGRLTRALLQRVGARRLVGVDPDAAEAAQATASGLYTAVHAVPGDRVPELDASFDWVLSNSVLEHIEDLDKVLREVARLLRPGGLFLFTVPSDGFRPALNGPLAPWSSRDLYLRRLDARLAHVRYWDTQRWAESLDSHGLRLDSVRSYLSRAEARRWETLSRFSAGVLYALFQGSRRPIEIQRRLGMRGRRLRVPAWAAALLARLLTAGLSAGPGTACHLISARKPG